MALLWRIVTEAIHEVRESHNCPQTFDTYFSCCRSGSCWGCSSSHGWKGVLRLLEPLSNSPIWPGMLMIDTEGMEKFMFNCSNWLVYKTTIFKVEFLPAPVHHTNMWITSGSVSCLVKKIFCWCLRLVAVHFICSVIIQHGRPISSGPCSAKKGNCCFRVKQEN